MTIYMTLRGVIVAIAAAIRGIAVIVVPVRMLAPRKSSRIVTCYDLLMRTSHNAFRERVERVVWVYYWELSNPTL